MAEKSLYSNHPLGTVSPYEIRLLTLHIESGSVSCNFHKADLSDEPAPVFSTLSYAWNQPLSEAQDGDPRLKAGEPLHTVECDALSIEVTDNLYYALVHLASNEPEGAYFWIDRLCIDQSNDQERGQQVGMMARIYSAAQCVVIWLGHDDLEVRKAAELIAALSSLTPEDRWSITPTSVERRDEHVLRMLEPKFFREDYWKSLALFYCRKWFYRAWVIQEVLMSQRTEVRCGDIAGLSWDSIASLSAYLARSAWRLKFADPAYLGLDHDLPRHDSPARLAATRDHIEKRKRNPLEPGEDNALLFSLIRSRSYLCQRPEDKVFSQLGVAAAHLQEHERHNLPKADYTLSVSELYTITANAILRSSTDLHILAHAEGSRYRVTPSLPSWAPDWSVAKGTPLGITGYKRYNACRGLLQALDTTRELISTTLGLQAAHISTIDAVGEPIHEVLDRCVFGQSLRLLQDFGDTYVVGKLSNIAHQAPSTETVAEAFWRTLVANTDDKSNCPAPEDIGLAFPAWLRRHCNSTDDTSLLTRLLPRTDAPTPDSVEQYQAGQPKNVIDICLSHKRDTRMFRTSEGHLGLGSASLEVGDTVWLVPGSRVPLGFRARSFETSTYELVGGTYLHGFMNGEALEGGVPMHDGLRPLDFETITLV